MAGQSLNSYKASIIPWRIMGVEDVLHTSNPDCAYAIEYLNKLLLSPSVAPSNL